MLADAVFSKIIVCRKHVASGRNVSSVSQMVINTAQPEETNTRSLGRQSSMIYFFVIIHYYHLT